MGRLFLLPTRRIGPACLPSPARERLDARGEFLLDDDHRGRAPFLIREAEVGDAPAMLRLAHAIFAEPGLYLPLTADEFTVTLAEEEAIIARHHEQPNAVFLLAFDAEGILCGMLNAHGSERRALRHAVEFGMSVGHGYRRQGVGRALLGALVDWAHRTPLVTRIELRVYVENEPARRLYESFGFEVEGRRRQSVFQDGRFHDDLLMSLLVL